MTIAVGLVPAWMVIRRDLIAAMKDGGHQTSQGLARAPVRFLLVGSQVAGCAVLLIVAGLMMRGVQRHADDRIVDSSSSGGGSGCIAGPVWRAG